MKPSSGKQNIWSLWLTEAFISMARHQGPEDREEIAVTARRCPLRRLLPKTSSAHKGKLKPSQ